MIIISIYFLFLSLIEFSVVKFLSLVNISPLTSTGEGVTVFISPYLSAGAPALGEAKGLILFF